MKLSSLIVGEKFKYRNYEGVKIKSLVKDTPAVIWIKEDGADIHEERHLLHDIEVDAPS